MSAHLLPGDTRGDKTGCVLCECEVNGLYELAVTPDDTAEGARATHDLFSAYVDAGFTREEALELTKAVTVEGMKR